MVIRSSVLQRSRRSSSCHDLRRWLADIGEQLEERPGGDSAPDLAVHVIEEVVQMVWGKLPVDYRVPPSLDFTAFTVFSTNYLQQF